MYSKPKIYIADLRHVADGVIANASMPLGTGRYTFTGELYLAL